MANVLTAILVFAVLHSYLKCNAQDNTFWWNKSERPVDALAVKKISITHSLTHSVTDNLKSRDASASKN